MRAFRDPAERSLFCAQTDAPSFRRRAQGRFTLSILWIKTGRALIAATALIVLCSVSRPADAQLSIIPKIRVKGGLFLPSNSSLKSATGSTWIKVGADVSLPIGIPLLSGGSRIGIDYMWNGSSNIIPITLTSTIQPSLGLTSPVYVGAGIGLWTGHIKGSGTSSKFGIRLLGGIDLGKSTFIEVNYDIVERIGGVRGDGYSVMIGMKF
jgi:hypothetical protein